MKRRWWWFCVFVEGERRLYIIISVSELITKRKVYPEDLWEKKITKF